MTDVTSNARTPTDTGFTAGYRTVTLRTDQWNTVGLGDCELLEQLQREVLPKLDLHSARAAVRCAPGNPTNARQSLKVRALIAVPKKPAER